MKKKVTRLTSGILLAFLLVSNTAGFVASAASNKSFYEFRNENSQADNPAEEIVLRGIDFTKTDSDFTKSGTVSDQQDVLLTGPDGSVSWTFNASSAGLYNIEVIYCPLEGKNNPIERRIYINDGVQYDEMGAVTFHRVYKNELDEVKKDAAGNELRENQIEVNRFETVTLYSSSYNVLQPLTVLLNEGENTIKFESISEPMAIKQIRFYQKEKEKPYSEVIKQYKTQDAHLPPIKVEGEDATYKSDKTLYAVNDASSSNNSPVSLEKTIMNMIGGSRWSSPLQYIEWEVYVPKTGVYKLNIRAKQDFTEGQVSSRRLYIDGKVPFNEANDLEFDYGIGFQNFVPSNDDGAYLFQLEEGLHTIRLENSVGKMGEILEKISLYVGDLNAIYKQVFMITGSYPDANRDYNIAKMLPKIQEQIVDINNKLEQAKQDYLSISKTKGNGFATIDKIQVQLKSFIEDIETVPSRLDSFRINISGLSSWVLEAVNQPLLIDYIEFVSPDQEHKNGKDGFFDSLWFGVKTFFVSFFTDYNSISISEKTNEEITLWIGTGRDQAQALKDIITRDFTPKHNIGVNIRLVDISVLLPAVASGYGPDVALSLASSLPMNYAYRGAVHELSQFEDFNEVAQRFVPASMDKFRYRDQYYAIPESFVFYMMFYRNDIIEEMGEKIPKTWDEMYPLLQKLQNQHMSIGLPNIGDNVTALFTTLLFQNGGMVYDEDMNKSMLDQEPSIKAFEQFTDFYTKYKVYQKIDPLTYFRTGQTPIVIMPYTFFANLQAAAPEIRGQWSFAEVPGTVMTDGSINNVVSADATGCCIFSNSKNKDAAWEFLKWWTDSPAQVAFATEMESVQGTAGRYASANLDAVSRLAWANSDLKPILEQAKKTRVSQEAPGGYMTDRYIVSGAMTVINNGLIPRETIMDYNKMINDEVQSMRKKFGLN